MFYPPVFWKIKARAALREHWLTGLLIALVVSLPSLLVQAAGSFTGNDLMIRLQNLIYSSVSANGAVNEELLRKGLETIQNSSGIWIMQGLNLLVWLLTPCLVLGQYNWMLLRLRGQADPGVQTVFSRLPIFFKSIGLRLRVSLRILLYLLPGFAIYALSFLPLFTADRSSRIAVLSSANTSLSLLPITLAILAGLGIFGALTYLPANILMADQPESRVSDILRRTRSLTRGQRGRIFLLLLSFLPLALLRSLLIGFAASLGSVPGLMVEMLTSLALTTYVYATLCAYVRDLLGEKDAPKEAEEVPGETPLN